MGDCRPPLSAALRAFGLAATVTVPDGAPVSTTVFWMPPSTEQVPSGTDFRRAEPQRVLVVPLSAVPAIPRETVIAVPLVKDGDILEWSVDGFERLESDHYRLVVVPHEQHT